MEKQVLISLKEFRDLENLSKVINQMEETVENMTCDFENGIYNNMDEEVKRTTKLEIASLDRKLCLVSRVINDIIK